MTLFNEWFSWLSILDLQSPVIGNEFKTWPNSFPLFLKQISPETELWKSTCFLCILHFMCSWNAVWIQHALDTLIISFISSFWVENSHFWYNSKLVLTLHNLFHIIYPFSLDLNWGTQLLMKHGRVLRSLQSLTKPFKFCYKHQPRCPS